MHTCVTLLFQAPIVFVVHEGGFANWSRQLLLACFLLYILPSTLHQQTFSPQHSFQLINTSTSYSLDFLSLELAPHNVLISLCYIYIP